MRQSSFSQKYFVRGGAEKMAECDLLGSQNEQAPLFNLRPRWRSVARFRTNPRPLSNTFYAKNPQEGGRRKASTRNLAR